MKSKYLDQEASLYTSKQIRTAKELVHGRNLESHFIHQDDDPRTNHNFLACNGTGTSQISLKLLFRQT